MSFASEVKKELVRLKSDSCCQKSELSALLKMGGDIILSSSGMKIEFKTTNPAIARKVISLTKGLYQADVELMSKRWMKLKKKNIFYVIIVSRVKEIMSDTELLDETGFSRRVTKKVIEKDCCKRAFLRGCFLAGGSVNSPYTSSYHLEVYSDKEGIIQDVCDLMNYFGLVGKTTTRANSFVAYIKRVEKISDFLRYIDAISISLFYEEIRIDRDLKYQLKRQNNVDIANASKSMKSSNEQLANIKMIRDYFGENIPERLLEFIKLREAYPEESMQELSEHSIEMLGKHISKSGINHRNRDLKKQIEEIKKRGE